MNVKASKQFLSTLCLSTLFIACSRGNETSDTKAAGRRIGSLKGLETLEDIINERIAVPGTEPFNLRRYLEREDSPSGLAALLGAFTEITGFSVQQRAVPNAVNTLLWEKVTGTLSGDLAELACRPSNTRLQETFFAAAQTLCASTTDAKARIEALESLWMSLARYDAPESELRSWIADETGADGIVSISQGEERVSALVQSILMNPYFMLEH